ncbi:hypothetical protein FLAG1_09465 [Fusarium langsethiae]|uniref:J domain-containing protein n=2 Tax=Fusarium sambucinum species complex TaxID=569360 RepID=A0A0M9EQS3_FUSLA|nr:hypothetical protein FLAG1_09465 [Fusarium langsethiae]OBS20559.1 hypothetical protein FPOA_06917 [Fusarium poae]GKU06779.1 unnamed protein product [Fusarium langsethiae]
MASQTSAVAGYKQPSVEDVSEKKNHDRKSGKFSVPYGASLLAIKDENLQQAIIHARQNITESWLKNELKNATAKDIVAYRKQLSSERQIEKISLEVAKNFPLGKRKTTGDVTSQIRANPEVIEFFIEYALDECMRKIESSSSKKRAEIERILSVQKEQGNEYEILGINEKITRAQLLQQRREILSAVHPDKNEDPEANNCTQAVNNALDKLLEKNQKWYEPPDGRSQNPREHQDMFGPGAFGSETEDSDEEDPVKKHIPDIPEEIKRIHKHISKYINPYFSTLEEDFPEIPDGVRKANNKIKRLNSDASRPVEAYLVTKAVLHALRKEQIRLVEVLQKEGAKEAEKQLPVLRQSYLKTSKLREHQWPESWGEVMEEAIRGRLNEAYQDNPPSEEGGEHSDTDMSDSANGSTSLTTLGSDTGVHSKLMVVRPITKLKPGNTLLGDKILGYRPMKRYNRYEGQYVTSSMKFFVQNPESEVFNIYSATDIGQEAALAYHRLADEEKNDVARYLEGVKNGEITPDAYNGILGVCAKESVYEMTDRFPETWVHIAVKGDDDSSKAKIINRTAFRELVDNADKEIDSFYVRIGVEPPWSTTPYPDPRNNVRYMSLAYPAPRRKALERHDRRVLKAAPFNQGMGSFGQNLIDDSPRRVARSYHDEPETSDHGRGDHRLIRAFERLTVMFEEQQREQRRHRELLESTLPRLIEDR